MDTMLSAALRRGKSHSQIAQQKNLCVETLKRGFFFSFPSLGDKAGSQQTVSITSTCLTARREGAAGQRESQTTRSPLANVAGEDCQAACEQGLGMLMGLETSLLGRRRIQASKARRKERKSGKKVKTGLIAGSFMQNYPTNNQAFLVTK